MESYGSVGTLVWDTDTAGLNIAFRSCNPECNSITQNNLSYAASGRGITLYTNPTHEEIIDVLGFRKDSNSDLGYFTINSSGSFNNSGEGYITNAARVATTLDYEFDFIHVVNSTPPVTREIFYLTDFNDTFANGINLTFFNSSEYAGLNVSNYSFGGNMVLNISGNATMSTIDGSYGSLTTVKVVNLSHSFNLTTYVNLSIIDTSSASMLGRVAIGVYNYSEITPESNKISSAYFECFLEKNQTSNSYSLNSTSSNGSNGFLSINNDLNGFLGLFYNNATGVFSFSSV